MTGNVADLVADAAARVPDRVALIDAGSTVTRTWAELDAEVDRLAAGYAGGGLSPGDRVVVGATTTIEGCAAVFAVLRAGGVVVPLTPDAPDALVRQTVADAGARFGVGLAGVPEPAAGDVSGSGGAAVDRAAAAEDAAHERAECRGEDLAVLCFTSGTTAGPSGVMLSHRALLANIEQCAAIRPAPVIPTDRVLVGLPLYHIYGLSAALFQVAAAGATAVLLDRFEPDRALDALAAHRVTTVLGVPSMHAALLAAADDQRLSDAMSTVRLLTSGAAPLPDRVRTEMRARTGLQIFSGYGLTEAAPVVTWSLASGVTKPGSAGRAIPGVELKLVDSDGADLPEPDESGDERDEGRVAIRGANLFSGYWPDGARRPGEGEWFVTGDVGYLDTDGDLYLIDRAADAVIVNGFNVFPHEVEDALSTMDGVVEVAVVGVPDERTGEAVKAVVVAAEGADVSADRVREHCSRLLARFKVPRFVEFVDALPHSATGKLTRRTLRS